MKLTPTQLALSIALAIATIAVAQTLSRSAQKASEWGLTSQRSAAFKESPAAVEYLEALMEKCVTPIQ